MRLWEHIDSKISSNFVWTLAGNAIYSGGQWATLVLLAKLTQPELVGQYALGLAVVLPVMMFTTLQLRCVVTTDVGEEVKFGHYLGFRLLSTGVGLSIVLAITLMSAYRRQLKLVILLVALGQAVEVISDVYYARLQLKDHLDRVAKSMIARTALSVLGLFAGVYFGKSLLWGVGGIVLARLIVFLSYDIRARTHDLVALGERISGRGVLTPCWNLDVQRQLLFLGLPLGVITILLSLTTNIPRYFIEHALGERALGIFSATMFMFAAGLMAVVSLGQSAFTRLASSYATGDVAEFKSVLGKLLVIAALVGVGGIVVAKVAGREILTLLFRPDYAQQNDLFVTIMVAAAIQYLAAVMGSAATAARFFKPQIPLLATVLVTTGVVSYWLIPSYGLQGAGMSIVITSFVLLAGEVILLAFVLRRARVEPRTVHIPKLSRTGDGIPPADLA